MLTQRELFRAVRGGEFVPFLPITKKLDIQSQLEEFVETLFIPDLVGVLKFVFKLSDKLPTSLTPKERLFCRCLRRGLIHQ